MPDVKRPKARKNLAKISGSNTGGFWVVSGDSR